MNFSTKLIHAGQLADTVTGAVNTPITTSTTFLQDGIGKFRDGYEYSRTDNPSRRSLEQTLAAIENGVYGLCFASGLAAESAVLSVVRPGEDVVTTADIYGGSYRLLTKVFSEYGIKSTFLYSHTVEDVERAITEKTRILWIETPTNPLLNIIDIAALAQVVAKLNIRRSTRILLVVDNTFATPYFQSPLDLGADIVVHSTTKYIGGHSDVVGGAVITNDTSLYEPIHFYQNAAGGVPSPFDCYLLQRGLKTLAVRMERHQSNAFEVVSFLMSHNKVAHVSFPGLQGHPGYYIAHRQMRGFPGMIAFRIKGGREAAESFVKKLKLVTFGESLGGVESLVCYPYLMTHGSIPEDEKNKIGITDDLIRVSVGIEDSADIIADINDALD